MKTFADYRIDVPANAHGETYTTCPECSSQRKKKTARCLSVNVEKGVWVCHHCGWSGGLSSGYQRSNLLHWRKPTYRNPEKAPETNLPPKVVEWFKGRGIPEAVLVRNKIGYGSVYMPQVEDFVSAIQFPYYRGGELVNIKYRDGSKNFRLEAGAERVFYGLDDIADILVIVEGEIDKLSLEVAGFKNCVSVPDGAPSPASKDYESKFSYLETAQEALRGVKTFILAVDSDAAGKRLEDELARRLSREKCSRVVWPTDCKDANEVLTKHGADVLRECIETAQPFPIHGVFDVIDLAEQIDHLYENGLERGVSTGWPSVDGCYTVRPGELTIVTGIPNSGKSNWLDALCVNLANHHDWRFAVFSPENQPIEDHISRLMEKFTGTPFDRGPTARMTKEQMHDAKLWVNAHFSWVLPSDDSEWTLEAILDAARQLVYRKGVRGLVIDPWNELEHQRPQHLSETEYVSQVLKRARQFARQNGVHVWIVAHPAKLYKDKDGRYPIPTPYDISGSAHWRNKADNCLCVWRDFGNLSNRVVQVHVQKIRFRQVGRLGMAELAYNHVTGTYHELKSANREIPPAYYAGGIEL